VNSWRATSTPRQSRRTYSTDVACFSIGAQKTLTSGEGGFLLTNNPEIYLRATLLGHFARRSEQALRRVASDGYNELAEKYTSAVIGFGENYRCHPYSAVMALGAIESGDFAAAVARRGDSLRYFARELSQIDGIDPPIVHSEYFDGAMYGFKPRLRFLGAAMSRVLEELQARNVAAKKPDTGLLDGEALLASVSNRAARYPGAESYLSGRISVPTFSGGPEEDQETIDEYVEVFDYVIRRTSSCERHE